MSFEFMELQGGNTSLSYAPFTLMNSEDNYIYPFSDYGSRGIEQFSLHNDDNNSPLIKYSADSLNIPNSVNLYPTRGPNGLLDTTYKINKEVMLENKRELMPTQQVLPPSRAHMSGNRGLATTAQYAKKPKAKKRLVPLLNKEKGGDVYVWHILLLIAILFLVHD